MFFYRGAASHTISQGEVQVLNRVSLITKGMTAIMGVSGSGKTTILNSLFSKHRMEVSIDIARTSYVTQHPHFIEELTIRENLSLFSNHSTQLESLSKELNITKILDHYPKETSMGERQRSSIVRALLTNPYNLILDEPTSALDSESKIKVLNLIDRKIKEGIISHALIVTHDPMVSEFCDKIYDLHQGELIERI